MLKQNAKIMSFIKFHALKAESISRYTLLFCLKNLVVRHPFRGINIFWYVSKQHRSTMSHLLLSIVLNSLVSISKRMKSNA